METQHLACVHVTASLERHYKNMSILRSRTLSLSLSHTHIYRYKCPYTHVVHCTCTYLVGEAFSTGAATGDLAHTISAPPYKTSVTLCVCTHACLWRVILYVCMLQAVMQGCIHRESRGYKPQWQDFRYLCASTPNTYLPIYHTVVHIKQAQSHTYIGDKILGTCVHQHQTHTYLSTIQWFTSSRHRVTHT